VRDDTGHAERTLGLASQLLEERSDQMVGVWPRAVAFLTRQALEDAMRWVWVVHAPGVENCSARAQLLSLRNYLGDEELAEEADHVYARLSWACHHHPYELAPTAGELRAWIDEVAKFHAVASRVASQAAFPA
jgi:hypothetical protein